MCHCTQEIKKKKHLKTKIPAVATAGTRRRRRRLADGRVVEAVASVGWQRWPQCWKHEPPINLEPIARGRFSKRKSALKVTK